MTHLYRVAVITAATLVSFVNASLGTCLNGLCAVTRANLTPEQVSRELGPLISKGSSIFGPSNPLWENATERYQTYMAPNITVVVQPALEDDIPKIVQYANHNSIEFLAVSRGHGWTTTLGRLSGIQIDLSLLQNITINPGGKTAWLQGGVYTQPVLDMLWEKGYVITTGNCACVGVLGAGLGGGHGRYQGFYGLIGDNFVTLNVVLANGTSITVSESSHPDLLWAMKGAGHNFGIVTSVEMNIYPRIVNTWYYKTYIYTQDKLETLFGALNKLNENGTQPKEMAFSSGMFMVNSTISETEAVIWWSFGYAGSEGVAQGLLEPFDSIGAVEIDEGNVPYPEIFHATGSGVNDPVCGKGFERFTATSGLQVWNTTTQRQIYDLFNEKVNEEPALAAGAVVLLESYSTEGVRAVSPESTAYALRGDNLLTLISVSPPADGSLDSFSKQWASQTRDLWNGGQPGRLPTSYTNYAFGDEPVQSMYGYEPWRLERLRALKAQYDPYGRFSYYNPFTPVN